MRCSNCGHEVSEDSLHCPNCGKELTFDFSPPRIPASDTPAVAVHEPKKHSVSDRAAYFKGFQMANTLLGLVVLIAVACFLIFA